MRAAAHMRPHVAQKTYVPNRSIVSYDGVWGVRRKGQPPKFVLASRAPLRSVARAPLAIKGRGARLGLHRHARTWSLDAELLPKPSWAQHARSLSGDAV